uniref:Secreted protein n=1 Tax=Heterorhabditis bacteriophora TaxID=37862 RepID=A0A1I7WFN8_HETBA
MLTTILLSIFSQTSATPSVRRGYKDFLVNYAFSCPRDSFLHYYETLLLFPIFSSESISIMNSLISINNIY